MTAKTPSRQERPGKEKVEKALLTFLASLCLGGEKFLGERFEL
jgi:hypothetical protein